MMACVGIASAQSYYDDDIYYDADKAKKEQAEALRKRVQANYVPNQSVDYPGADTYTVNSGSTRDVDEYNRHNLPVTPDTLRFNADGTETFAYTSRIERFHNPDVVSGSDDDELQYLYYTAQEEPKSTVNIYVNGYTPYPGWSSWCCPAYYSPWYWDSYYYRPYYSWTWGYRPYWSWGWGPAWDYAWGWGPGWDYGWGWGPVYPGWGGRPRPQTPSGSSRPHYDYGYARPSDGRRYGGSRPAYGYEGSGDYRPSTGTRPSTGSRPAGTTVSGVSTGNLSGSQSGQFRPSYETRTGRRPGSAGYGTGSTGGGNRTPSYGTGNSGGRRQSGYNSNSRNNSTRNSTPSYRSNSNSGSRGGYSGGGSRGSSGGGSRGGGGGGGSRGRH